MDKNKEMFDRLVKGLRDIYGDKLVSILLYGSFARKTNTKESDIDIAVLLNGKETKEIRRRPDRPGPPARPKTWDGYAQRRMIS